MEEQTGEIPSPASLAGEGEGEGTERLGRGGARDLRRRLAKRSPHLNPLPRVVRERRTFHFAVDKQKGLTVCITSARPNQPLEATAGSCRALASRRSFTRRASAA